MHRNEQHDVVAQALSARRRRIDSAGRRRRSGGAVQHRLGGRCEIAGRRDRFRRRLARSGQVHQLERLLGVRQHVRRPVPAERKGRPRSRARRMVRGQSRRADLQVQAARGRQVPQRRPRDQRRCDLQHQAQPRSCDPEPAREPARQYRRRRAHRRPPVHGAPEGDRRRNHSEAQPLLAGQAEALHRSGGQCRVREKAGRHRAVRIRGTHSPPSSSRCAPSPATGAPNRASPR